MSEHHDSTPDPAAADTPGLATAEAAPESNPHTRAMLTLANAMFRYALWPSLGTLVLGVVLFGLLRGGAGALGAAVGGALACVSSLITLALMRATANQGPHIGMAASLGGFVGKLLLLLIVMTLLRGVDALEPKSLGITMVAVVVVAAAAEAVAFRRTKLPTIIPAGEK
jgi:ATP synthase protein I